MRIRNAPDAFVDDALDGLIAAYPHLVARGPHPRVVVRARAKAPGLVGLAIANGSGHEPIAVGWVGRGLLDANGVGDVFTAPGPGVVAAAIEAADRGDGVVLLVSNHDGDVMNAELGVEDARAAGHHVDMLVMGDDLATAPPERRQERRGAAGTTFVYKVLGAAAERGMDRPDLVDLGRRVLAGTSTLSITLGGGTNVLDDTPLAGPDLGHVLIGAGVHGEGGTGATNWAPADALVGDVVDRIVDDLPVSDDEQVLVLVNGAGGTTLAELWVAARTVIRRLDDHGLRAHHPLVAPLITTADTRGVSVAVARTDPEIRELWTDPCRAPYFPQP